MPEPGYDSIFQGFVPVHGLHAMEADTWGPFVWSAKRFELRKVGAERYYLARLCFNGDEAVLSIKTNGGTSKEVSIARGWNNYPLDFSDLDKGEIEFELSDLPPVPGDPRELGIMVRRVRALDNRRAFDRVTDALANKQLNDREFSEKRIRLQSLPQHIRLALESRCNMDPHCVYCEFEHNKQDRPAPDFQISLETLDEMGEFYRLAERIGELGCGEPLLNRDFARLVESFHRCGKPFALTTNGLLLNSHTHSSLLGKDVELYVSLDSSTDEGYRRYRSGNFDLLLDNVRALCSRRQGHEHLPNVIASFVAMKSNAEEFPAFVDLVKEVGMDGIRVASLHGYPRLQQRVDQRAGFSFNYADEYFTLQELLRFLDDAKAIAAARNMPLLPCTDFNAEDAHVNGPLCNEPWKTMNVSARGLLLCSHHTGGVVADWEEQGERSLEQFMADVWNGERYREIRSALAEGRLAKPCIEAHNCVFARKELEGE